MAGQPVVEGSDWILLFVYPVVVGYACRENYTHKKDEVRWCFRRRDHFYGEKHSHTQSTGHGVIELRFWRIPLRP